jgi:hypothetical protein
MRIIKDDLEDFEPPFANHEPDREPDTFQAITIDLTSENAEYLWDVVMTYLADNVEVLSDDEFIKLGKIQDLIKPAIIPGKYPTPSTPA